MNEETLQARGDTPDQEAAPRARKKAVVRQAHRKTGTSAQPRSAGKDSRFPVSSIPAVNVAEVPQRSPLRYPGGKTWLVPHVRHWLKTSADVASDGFLLEPFAGGGIISLTAVMENRVNRAVMVELDRDVAAFWRAVINHGESLVRRIRAFQPTRERVIRMTKRTPSDIVAHGFRTLVLNRTRRGGILAGGASLSKNGENGKGILSRWYPDTLCERINDIRKFSDRLAFFEGDGMSMLRNLVHCENARFFIDPPYTAAGGKKAGERLYAHNTVKHREIFELMADCRSDFLMTYDYSDEVVQCVKRYKFHAVSVTMKNTHHAKLPELVITRRKVFS